MNDKNYVDHYIEILTGTMTEQVMKNISMQANARMTDIAIGQLNEKVLELESIIESKNSENVETGQKINDYEARMVVLRSEYDARINDLNSQIASLHSIRADYETAKNDLSHLETFRNELVKEREEHQRTREELSRQIVDLNDQLNVLKNPVIVPEVNIPLEQPVETPVETSVGNINQISNKESINSIFSKRRKGTDSKKPAPENDVFSEIRDGGSF